MLNLRAFLTLSVALTLGGSAIAGSPCKNISAAAAGRVATVSDHVPQLDGPLTMTTAPSGRALAAWAYHASGEFDIAVSSREPGTAIWSAPVFFGRRNGNDETEPTITFDANGNAYLAFTAENPSRVSLAVLLAGSSVWSEPVVVSGKEVASSPSLLVVGDRVVVAYRSARGVGMIDLPAGGVANQINSIQEGPDGVDPLGIKRSSGHSDVSPTLPPPGPKP